MRSKKGSSTRKNLSKFRKTKMKSMMTRSTMNLMMNKMVLMEIKKQRDQTDKKGGHLQGQGRGKSRRRDAVMTSNCQKALPS